METTCEQNDYYPPYLSIRVNDRINQTVSIMTISFELKYLHINELNIV